MPALGTVTTPSMSDSSKTSIKSWIRKSRRRRRMFSEFQDIGERSISIGDCEHRSWRMAFEVPNCGPVCGGPRGLAHSVAKVLRGRTAKRVIASPAICHTGNELNRGRSWMADPFLKIDFSCPFAQAVGEGKISGLARLKQYLR